MSPAIITVAITGSVPRKADNTAVPITPAEQIESTHEAYEAGASIVHIHVRNDDESPSSEPGRFAKVQEGVAKHCPGMVIQFSTGGRGRVQSERASCLDLNPDMASLATGSVNFPQFVYENPHDFVLGLARTMRSKRIKPEIEVFDAAMLYRACALAEEGVLARPLHVQFVLGIALPVREKLLRFLVDELRTLEPDATWSAMGTGRNQLTVNELALKLGGHPRTGFEDNVKYDSTRNARSNAELVSRVAAMCREAGRSVASCSAARELLGLPKT